MELIRNYIYQQVAEKKIPPQEAEKMIKELMQKNKTVEDDIAIIGISGKYPGADDLNEFWENIKNRKNSIQDFSEERIKDGEHMLNYPLYGEVLVGVPITHENVTYPKGGYFKNGVDKFDWNFFSISPREALFIDPAHRIFLETAWEAIEDAGYGGKKIYGSKTGVYVGQDTTNISLYKHMTEMDTMHLTGSWAGILASRISYIFNLTGPSMVIDTACSSGLVCVHNACQALKNKECDMAIAGGLNLLYMAQTPKGEPTIMDLGIVESPTETVSPFDNNANGTLWGEGVGAVILKPLKKALKDGDFIHAVIKGTAINNDGASNGITAPNAVAQENVICEAWENAKINPETISYIEAHGTATSLGDSIELKGLTESFRRYTDKKQFCAIGSAKSTIGHTVAASGLAALSKIIMGMKHRTIPPCANFERPNKYVDFCNAPFYVANKAVKWEPNGDLIRAGVSSFGFSGTNCHIVLEEPPRYVPKKEKKKESLIFTLSAKKENILNDYLAKYDNFLKEEHTYSLEDICYTVSIGRGHYSHRLALLVHSLEDLKEKIGIIRKEGLRSLPEKEIYYGWYKLLSGNRTPESPEEITENIKWSLEEKGGELLDKLSTPGTSPEAVLKEICEVYIKGGDIEWSKLYKEGHKLSLPYYPLERVRCWAGPKKSVLKEYELDSKNKVGHLLLDRVLVETKDECIYLTDFDPVNKWVIGEHKFLDNFVLPGISYLELGRKACSKYYGDTNVELRDVVFLEAMVVEVDEVKQVHTIVKDKNSHLEFQVVSKADYGDGFERWMTHAEGKAFQIQGTDKKINLGEIEKKCAAGEIDLTGEDVGKAEFTLGDRWDTIRSIKMGEDQNLVEIELREEFLSDLDELVMHPSMLDNAANAALLQIKADIYLPFSYKSLKIYRQFPPKFYSNIRFKGDINSGAETVSFDITLFDKKGNILADIEQYTIKKVNKSEQRRFEELAGKGINYFSIDWQEAALPEENRVLADTLLVIGSDTSPGKKICSHWKDKEIIPVQFGESFEKKADGSYVIGKNDFSKLMESLKDKELTEILYCRSRSGKDDLGAPEALDASLNEGVYGIYWLTRAILDAQIKQKINITLISENVDSVTGEESNLNPQDASFFGIGKVIIQEYPNIRIRCIDVDEKTDSSSLAREVGFTDRYRVAWRNGKRYAEVFGKSDIVVEEAPALELKTEGAYIVTGGTGGIGLAVTEHLSQKAGINIVLINRSTFPPADQWDKILEEKDDPRLCDKILTIQRVLKNGASVETLSADISDYSSMEKVIGGIKKKYGKINGVIHCAGNAGDGYILNKTYDVFQSVLLPKINGTVIMNNLTKDQDLDFFILFSSVTTLQSFPGQSDYTSANSFMDSFAAWSRREGRKVTSINWPGWKDTGMAADYNISDEMLFFKLITSEKGLDALDIITSSDKTRILPGELNYNAVSVQKEQLLLTLSDDIEQAVQRYTAKLGMTGQRGISSADVTLSGKSDGMYTEIETVIGKIFGGVLGLAEVDIHETFNEMGGDSILATQLYKEIDKEYPGVIDITNIFSYPTVVDMSRFISGEDMESGDEDSIEDDYDAKLMDMIEGVEKGDIDIDDGLDSLE